MQAYIQASQQKNPSNGGPYTKWYTGSMVADCHRNLPKGGIFLYPATRQHAEGKLRLVYECNPFAFIIEMAGEMAISGQQPILDMIPRSLHKRVPFIAGSKEMGEAFKETKS